MNRSPLPHRAWVVGVLLALASAPAAAQEQAVPIQGYSGGVEEPFVSRDGAYLLFSTSETEQNKDLQLARFVDGALVYERALSEVNDAAHVVANPTMDRDGRLYFIKNDGLGNTPRVGRFDGVRLGGVHEVSGNLPAIELLPHDDPGLYRVRLIMGVEVSADGRTLYFSWATFVRKHDDATFNRIEGSRIGFARATAARDAFGDPVFDFDAAEVDRVLAALQAPDALSYAPGISRDERTVYFTRMPRAELAAADPQTELYRATRSAPDAPFGAPARVSGLAPGFIEAPTWSADEQQLYFHRKPGGAPGQLYRLRLSAARADAGPALDRGPADGGAAAADAAPPAEDPAARPSASGCAAAGPAPGPPGLALLVWGVAAVLRCGRRRRVARGFTRALPPAPGRRSASRRP